MSDYKWYPDDYQMGIEPHKKETSLIVSEATEQPKKKKKMKPWVVALVTALITSLLCTGVLGAFVFVPALSSLSSGSAVIYRDGEDMRNKVDLSTALGLQGESASGQEPMSIVDIARQVGPAVVGIVATGESSSGMFLIPSQTQSSGSGIIISSDGYIVTNNHVVENATSLKVTLNTMEEYDAKIVGTDPQTDLAVIKIEATGLTSAVLGNSSDVEVGELAIAIGNPLGQELAGTVTTGIISATNRQVTVDDVEYTLLQTDAAINEGNSGGALVNAYGEVIGINSVKMASTGVEGLGFAIPSDIAKPVISDLIEYGYVTGRPVIGITGRNITEEMSRYYDLPVGVYIQSITEFSAAEKAGLRPGDVIIQCDGQTIETVDELNEIRDQHQVGDTLALTVVRDGQRMDVSVTLQEDRSSVPTPNPNE
ncbi:MAG TPA: trypsin-like peptidase domain-containing protein [Candidatus Aphodoplasma excrementigallinarum]|uniref:Trypsin-like peptidase domain-containing protein n=1 Tax=Candidatus Aphodoplasma excrementigallinarum TaxID=2840673 RepID=A0A9D1NFT7_9FIRM|nr:trypsin-like peptidase domain-containing protein [Candidatus Aphodoplasma excrementigallinarum]